MIKIEQVYNVHVDTNHRQCATIILTYGKSILGLVDQKVVQYVSEPGEHLSLQEIAEKAWRLIERGRV